MTNHTNNQITSLTDPSAAVSFDVTSTAVWENTNIHRQMADSNTWWLLRVVADFAACKKWQQEKKNRDHAWTQDLRICALFPATQAIHPGHNPSSPMALCVARGSLQCCNPLGPVPSGLNCAVVHSEGSYVACARARSGWWCLLYTLCY